MLMQQIGERQAQILEILYNKPNHEERRCEMQSQTKLESPRLEEVLKSLQRKNFIAKKTCGRHSFYMLTEEGENFYREYRNYQAKLRIAEKQIKDELYKMFGLDDSL